MEEPPALVFKYKCRRNMFVARPVTCRPVVQSPTPIISFHHRPTKGRSDGKVSHAPIAAALTPIRKILRSKSVTKAKSEPELKETLREEASSPMNKEVTLEFQRSYNSSLHLNVSPTSSINFDRRDVSSRIKLLAVVQHMDSEELTEKCASTASSPKLPEEEGTPTSSKLPRKLGSTAIKLLSCAKDSEYDGGLGDAERPGSVGDIETVVSEELKTIQCIACVSGDENWKTQPEVKRSDALNCTISHQKVIVRQLPLSYAQSDGTFVSSSMSRGIQCSIRSDGMRREEENAPPLRSTAPDSPYVSLYKSPHETYETVCFCHTRPLRIQQTTNKSDPQVRHVSTSTSDAMIGGREGVRVARVMQTDPPRHDKSTQYTSHITRQSQTVQTAFSPPNSTQRRLHAPHTSKQTIVDIWDTATMSDNSQGSADPLCWHLENVKQQRRSCNEELQGELKPCRLLALQNATLDCRGDHSRHYHHRRRYLRRRTHLPNTTSTSTQTPHKLPSFPHPPTSSKQTRASDGTHLKCCMRRYSVTRSATISPPLTPITPYRHHHGCLEVGRHMKYNSPVTRRVVKSNDPMSLRRSYQMHTFSSILKRQNHPRFSPHYRNNAWK
ncbi:unnamed protein product [Hydatigera taeniaeformis]|uniref:Non-specific serine/threonine protein kinase n=1 Tax=Hydatigena taeniaeformis TaxID=6205 RepID=A0A0R3WJA1_HYDTA|nr:unnamed protein product [Hydatigera taeniaeformis]